MELDCRYSLRKACRLASLSFYQQSARTTGADLDTVRRAESSLGYFTARDGSPALTIAGLWDDWQDKANLSHRSYPSLTTSAQRGVPRTCSTHKSHSAIYSLLTEIAYQ